MKILVVDDEFVSRVTLQKLMGGNYFTISDVKDKIRQVSAMKVSAEVN